MILMRQLILRACALAALAAYSAAGARAQSEAAPAEQPAAPAAGSQSKTSGSLFALEEVERQWRAQRGEMEQLRAAVREESRLIGELRAHAEEPERLAAARPGGGGFVREAAYTDGAGGAAPAGPQAAAS